MADTLSGRRSATRAKTREAAGWLSTTWRWEYGLICIVILGALLRFHGLGWDEPDGASYPLQMHPDERFLSIVQSGADWPDSPGGYFNTETSPLNPYNVESVSAYVYGTFPLFASKGLATAADRGVFAPFEWAGVAVPAGDPPGPDNSYDQSVVWGRALTAAVDTLTIVLVFAAGAVLFNRTIGLLGALGYALAVLPTQLAHFFTMDPYVTFFALATLVLAAQSVTALSGRELALLTLGMGMTVGLGLASKVTAWPIVMLPVVAVGIRIGLRELPALALRWRGRLARPEGNWALDISWLCLVLVIGALVFRVFQPYAFATPDFGDGPTDWIAGAASVFELNPQWRADMEREVDFQNGNVDFPPFVQFADGTPFVTPVKQIVSWGLGPALALAGIAGTVAAGVQLFRRRELAFVLPLALAAAIFLFQGPRFVAFMRYFVPMYPVLTLLAAWGAYAAWMHLRSLEPGARFGPGASRFRPRVLHVQRGLLALFALVIVTTAWWALAFQNVYREEHPRIQASEWIYANAPEGSTITGELWDDTVPYALPEETPGNYQVLPLDMYSTDSHTKVRQLVYGPEGDEPGGLADADYVAITSGRVRENIPKLEAEYPATIRYYELLESGELGFERAAEFEVRPSFLGISVDDAGAEEAFTVYDHPEVELYEKTEAFDADRAFQLLMDAHPERAVNLLPKQGSSNGLLLTQEAVEAQQEGGTFSDIFDGDAWTNKPAWLWWFVYIQLAAFATVPLLGWAFRALPDRGYALSKLAGFAAPGLITWLVVSWGLADMSRPLVLGSWGAILAAGIAVGIVRRHALLADLRQRWKAWTLTEALFLAFFVVFLLMRAFNPDVWHHPRGGEKPMEMAYLTAVARSTELPPFDPWFGGGSMNYYYMGWYLLAMPMRALQTLPEVALNIGVAVYAGLAASVAGGIAFNLVAWSRESPGGPLPRPAKGLGVPIVAGAAGAVLLLGIGNLDGGHQAIERLQAVNDWGLFEGVPVVGGAVGILGGLWAWAFDGAQLPPFDWWRSSRVHFGQLDITEFPFFTFLFADLHPHLMGLPFFGLTIGSAVGYVASVVREQRWQPWALAALLGVCLGLVRTVHTWDFPTAVLIASAAIITGQVLAQKRWQDRWWKGVAHLAITAGVLLVAFAPYTQHSEVHNAGIGLAPETTQPQQYFAHFGLFVVVALAFLVVRYREELEQRDHQAGRNPALVVVLGWWEVASLGAFLLGLGVLTWQFGLTVVAISLVLLLFLGNLLWLEWRAEHRNPARLLVTAMFMLAFGIAAGVDVVTLDNDIVRMNTVFKFSMQAWQLFAIASAFGTWYVLSATWARGRGLLPATRPGWHGTGVVFACVAGVLLIGSLVYPIAGTAARQGERFADTGLTLDGLVFIDHGEFPYDRGTQTGDDDVVIDLADDEPLIRWLRQNVEGSPIIAEAVGPLYHWTGRISMLTGLPAVIGWDWHQTQQRWDYQHLIQERRAATEQFYTSDDPGQARDYLRRYNVQYVVVGAAEYAYGTEAAMEKIDGLDALTEVFEDGRYGIYRVDQEALDVEAGEVEPQTDVE